MCVCCCNSIPSYIKWIKCIYHFFPNKKNLNKERRHSQTKSRNAEGRDRGSQGTQRGGMMSVFYPRTLQFKATCIRSNSENMGLIRDRRSFRRRERDREGMRMAEMLKGSQGDEGSSKKILHQFAHRVCISLHSRTS